MKSWYQLGPGSRARRERENAQRLVALRYRWQERDDPWVIVEVTAPRRGSGRDDNVGDGGPDEEPRPPALRVA